MPKVLISSAELPRAVLRYVADKEVVTAGEVLTKVCGIPPEKQGAGDARTIVSLLRGAGWRYARTHISGRQVRVLRWRR